MRILCELYPDTMIMLMKEGIQNGITLEILMTKKHKKTLEEKAAVADGAMAVHMAEKYMGKM